MPQIIEKKLSKRQEFRERRRKREQRQRIFWIGLASLLALALIGVFVIPPLIPVSNVVEVTPISRPNPQGLSIGDANAPIKVEEFADFQCPGCKYFAQNVESSLIRDYIVPGTIQFTFVPLAFIGPESEAAVEAAYCANSQGKFWEYHDMLFANQTGENVGDFDQRRLVAYAQKVGIDRGAFNRCLSGNDFRENLSANREKASTAGMTVTPSFLVNGKLVEQANLISEIDSLKSTLP